MYEKILLIGLKNYPDVYKQATLFGKSILTIDSCLQDVDSTIFADVDIILISIYQELPKEFLKLFSNLKLINVFGTSTKKIDLDYCLTNRIEVNNVTDYCDHETAEWVLWQSLNFFRNQEPVQSFYGKTLGVIGTGQVGKKLVLKALSLGANVNFFALSSHKDLIAAGGAQKSLEEIFMHSDAISFHTPAFISPLNENYLKLLKKNAVLINTCMGEVFHKGQLTSFLKARLDITLVMDSIAAKYFPNELKNSFSLYKPAYLTNDSQHRIFEKFFDNLSKKKFK